jgi:hypothetical protein
MIMVKPASFPCPSCGEEVPARARACPACGADENSGWSDKTVYDGTDIPNEEEFDYGKILENEGLVRRKRSQLQRGWVVVTAILILIFILFLVTR